MNKTIILSIICILIITNFAVAVTYQNLLYPNTQLNGAALFNRPTSLSDDFNINSAITNMGITNENMNVFYYKVFVPNDNDSEWNLSKELMERKPTIILHAYPASSNGVQLSPFTESGFYKVYVCCNITKGDLLYTANATNPDGSFNITLAGTLTNNYDLNWKTRVYNGSSSSWGNVNVGASTNPNVYNRRAKLHSDGTMIGYAMESVNVTVPILIKIYKV